MTDSKFDNKLLIECTAQGLLVGNFGEHQQGLIPLIIVEKEHADSLIRLAGRCGYGEIDGEPARVAGVAGADDVNEKMLAAFGFASLVMEEYRLAGNNLPSGTIWGKEAVEFVARNAPGWDFENGKPVEENAPGSETIQ